MASVILGFGKTEKASEQGVEDQIRAKVADKLSQDNEGFFSGEFRAGISVWLDDMANELRLAADRFGTEADHPDHYSYFYPVTLGDANYLVFILKFHHVNRKHPYSPDGWALLQSERVFYVRHGD